MSDSRKPTPNQDARRRRQAFLKSRKAAFQQQLQAEVDRLAATAGSDSMQPARNASSLRARICAHLAELRAHGYRTAFQKAYDQFWGKSSPHCYNSAGL